MSVAQHETVKSFRTQIILHLFFFLTPSHCALCKLYRWQCCVVKAEGWSLLVERDWVGSSC